MYLTRWWGVCGGLTLCSVSILRWRQTMHTSLIGTKKNSGTDIDTSLSFATGIPKEC